MTQIEKIQEVLKSNLPDALKVEVAGRLANGENVVPYYVYPATITQGNQNWGGSNVQTTGYISTTEN